MDIDTYRKTVLSQQLFELESEGENPIHKFFQIGKGNRIHTTEQATQITTLRFFFSHMGFDWGEEFCDWIENYQGTCGLPSHETNSREMGLAAIQFDRALSFEKGRGHISIGQPSAPGGK